MAIEFNCPYCTATVRVGDNAAGRMGKCPKCQTRILVPRPAAPPPPSVDIPQTIDLPPELPGADAFAPPAAEQFPVFPAAAPQPVADLTEPPPLGVLPNPTAPSARPSALARKVRRRAGSRNWMRRLVPIGFGLILLALGGWFAVQMLLAERLEGELNAEHLETFEVPPVLIGRELFDLHPKHLDPLLEHLAADPLPLTSSRMDVQFRGSEKGVTISLSRGKETEWYRVDVRSNPVLGKYYQRESVALDEPRMKQVARAADEFIHDYQAVRAKEADITKVTPYRDSLGLNALVRGFGYHVMVASGQTLYPCVHEDADGGLFFLLPKGLKQFTLQGKQLARGETPFPGKYTVTVRSGKPAAPSPTSPPASKPEPDSDEPEREPTGEKQKAMTPEE